MKSRALRLLALALVLMIGLTACDGDRRNVRDSRAVFRALIADPIPAGVSDIATTGHVSDGHGHMMYLRFAMTADALDDLLQLRRFEPFDCEDEFVQGSLTLSNDLERDIPDWSPFDTEGALCYASGRSYTNQWTRGARAVMLVQAAQTPADRLTVYYNELGL